LVGPDLLLLLGLVVVLGAFGGRIFQWLKVPEVIGYIVVGLLVGRSALDILNPQIVEQLAPLTSIALGFIGFTVGGSLRKEVFVKYGKSVYAILLAEGLLAFALVAAITTLVSGNLALGLILGALASATAPAGTVDVLWEYKSKGILTTTLLAIVALDDALALTLYGFCTSFSKALVTGEGFSLLLSVGHPLLEIGKSVLLGLAAGIVIHYVLKRTRTPELSLVFIVGAILFITGAANFLKLDLILPNMVAGLVYANLSPARSKSTFAEVMQFSPPVYVLFYILVGARLQVSLLPQLGLIGVLYLLGRTFGKFFGARLGASLGKAAPVVRKYLGFCLLSQSGVAIGLSISVYQSFGALGAEGQHIGVTVVNLIAATTIVVQLLGPAFVKFSVEKAGEIGRSITAADLIERLKVADVASKDITRIKVGTTLGRIMEIFSTSDDLYFPVVDERDRFVGMITFNEIRRVLTTQQIGDLVVAADIAVKPAHSVRPDQPLSQALRLLEQNRLDFVPVLEGDKLIGILSRHSVDLAVRDEVVRRGASP